MADVGEYERTIPHDDAVAGRALFDLTDDAIGLFERLPLRADGKRDYRSLAINPALRTLFDLPDVAGCSVRDSFPDEAEAWYDDFDRVLETGEPARIERRSEPQGMILQMIVSRVEDGTRQRVMAVMRDVTASRLAEEAQRDSEERFRAFVTASDDVVYRMSPDWSEMRQLEGKAFLRDTGEPAGDWLDRYIHPDDQALVRGAIDRAIEGKAMFALEHRVHRADGTLGWTRSHAVPILDDRGNIREWLGAASDVTAGHAAEVARSTAEAASRQAEGRYLTLFNAIDQGFCTVEMAFDADDRPVDYRFVEVSLSFERQTGIADAAGRWMRDIAPDQDQSWFDIYGRVARTRQPVRFEEFSTPLDRWWEVFAFPVEDPAAGRVGVLFRDISDRKRTEAAQRASEERQAFLLHLSDALRPLDDTLAIERTAVDLLGRQLAANRVFYATIESDGDTGIVRHDFVDGVASGTGRYSLASFRPARIPEWQAGHVTMTTDSETDPALDAAERATYAAVETRAAVGVPLVKAGKLVALLAVNQSTPRRWTEQEVALIVDVAERTWAAIQRARAEAALRESEERFRALAQSIEDVFYLTDLDRDRLIYLSASYQRIWGRPVAELMADLPSFIDTILPEDRDIVLAGLERRARGEAVRSEYRILRPDGEVRWILDRSFPVTPGQDGSRRSAGNATDVTVQKRAESALRESEGRFAQFAASSSDGLWIRAAETLHMEYTSPAIAAIYGVAPDALIGDPERWTALILPEDRDKALAHLKQARGGAAVVHEFRIRRPSDGDVRWIRDTDFPLRDDQGGIQRIGGIAEDVTESRQLSERQVVLLAELQHRVRNILTVVRSVFGRTVEAGGDLEDIADHFAGRLDSLARTQVVVTQSATGLVDLENLIRDELLSVGVSDGPTVEIIGPDVHLPPLAAESIGLAIHELTTNSLKYGALKIAGAQLVIEWTNNLHYGGQRRLNLKWTEQGVPAIDLKPARKGFGTELIEEALPYRLGAETSLQFSGGGVRCTISVPLPQ